MSKNYLKFLGRFILGLIILASLLAQEISLLFAQERTISSPKLDFTPAPAPAPGIIPAANFASLNLAAPIKNIFIRQWASSQILKELGVTTFSSPLSLGKNVGRILGQLFYGKFGKKIAGTLTLPRDLIKKDCRSNSLLHYLISPGNIVQDLVNDVVVACKMPKYRHLQFTPRIRVCSLQMPIAPAQHLYFVIDQGEYNTRQGRSEYHSSGAEFKLKGQSCEWTPLKSGESASLAIERLKCIDRQYAHQVDYRFLTYNCGGETKDCLNAAGVGFNNFSNFGIGQKVSLRGPLNEVRYNRTVGICQKYIQSLQKLLLKLEHGQQISRYHLQTLIHESKPSKDSLLQMIVSAERGGNAENKALLKRILSQLKYSSSFEGAMEITFGKRVLGLNDLLQDYLEKDDGDKIQSIYRQDLQRILQGLDLVHWSNIFQDYPVVKKIATALKVID